MNQYFMLTHHLNFVFQYIFRQFNMNIDCGKIIRDLDDSEDEFRGYLQKIMILRLVQQICL